MKKRIQTQIGLALILGLFGFISSGSLNWLRAMPGSCGISGYPPCPSPYSGFTPPPCQCWRGVCYSFSATFNIPSIGASPSGPSGYYVPGLGIINVPWVASGLSFRCVERFGGGRCGCPTGEWYLSGYYLSGVGPMSEPQASYYFTPSGIVVGTGITSNRYFYIPGIGAFFSYGLPFVWGTGYYDRGPGIFVPGRGYWIPSLGIIPEIGQQLVGSGRWRPGTEYVPSEGIYQERVDLTGYYFKYLDKLYPRQEEFCVYKNLVGLKIDLDDDGLNDCIEDLCPDFSNPDNDDRDSDLLGDVCDVTTKKFLPNELTTDFFERRDWHMPNEIKLGIPGKGSVEFKEKISNLNGVNLDEVFNIEHNLVSLDPAKAPQLNKPARITLYNLPFKEPKILKDGEKCPSTNCTMISYSEGTLIFEVTSFSTYSIAEGAPAPPTTAGPSACGDWPPTGAPVLFLIETTKDTATLYFTPVKDHLSYYYIAYGYSEGDERFGVEFPASLSKGVESYTIKSLAPKTTYYFRVRGGNGCAPGEWSDWLMAKTESGGGIKEVVTKTPQETGEEEMEAILPPSGKETSVEEVKPKISPPPILLSFLILSAVGMSCLITGKKGIKVVVIILVVAGITALMGWAIMARFPGERGEEELVVSVSMAQKETSQDSKEKSESQEMVGPSTVKLAVPKGHGVNLRTGPSLESEVITILWWPKEYPFLARENGWIKIEAEIEKDALAYSEGWVSEEFVKEIEK